MAVPGRNAEVAESNKSKQPEELSQLFCQPCEDDGQQLLAAGFCVDCCEYLCDTCFTHHCRARPVRHHVLLDRTTMPRSKPKMEPSDVTADKCNAHQGEIIKFYCSSHEHFGCATCIAVDHHNCEGVSYVEKEYDDLAQKLADLKERIASYERNIEGNGKDTEKYYSDVIVNIGQFRKEINDLLDKFEHDITAKAKTIKDEDQAMMTSVSVKMDDMKSEINSTASEIDTLHNLEQIRKLFAIIEKTKEDIKRLDGFLTQIQNESRTRKYTFEPENQFKYLLGNLKSIGRLAIIDPSGVNKSISPIPDKDSKTPHTRKQQGQQQYKQQIRTTQTVHDSKQTQTVYTMSTKLTQTENSVQSKSIQAQTECHTTNLVNVAIVKHMSDISVDFNSFYYNDGANTFTGLVMLPDNTLVIVDHNNNTVKLVNTTLMKMESIIKLSSTPWNCTTINNRSVAVTLPNKRTIQLLYVECGSLSRFGAIKVNGKCRGIAYNDRTLVVTFVNPGKVELINMRGDVLRRVVNDASGPNLLDQPQSIAINPDKTVVYISDFQAHSVICMTLEGKVKAVYKDNNLKNPAGLAIDRNGTVYVCGHGSNNIHQITADCTKIQILPSHQHGISRPQSITYCDQKDTLYVATRETHILKTYQLKY